MHLVYTLTSMTTFQIHVHCQSKPQRPSLSLENYIFFLDLERFVLLTSYENYHSSFISFSIFKLVEKNLLPFQNNLV